MPDDQLRYEANARSLLLAYLLWFFLGWFGLHRFYLGRPVSGLVMLLLNGLGWLLFALLIGYVFWGLLGLWWCVDAVLMPSMAEAYNNRVVDRIRAGG